VAAGSGVLARWQVVGPMAGCNGLPAQQVASGEATRQRTGQTVEAATHLAVCNHLEEFEYGLDLMITALELRLPRS
jgi:hypothetical protein